MNSVRELMEIHGYRLTGSCYCDGSKTMKYKKGAYEFRWRINKYQFKVKLNGVTIKAWKPVKEAENYLNGLHAEFALKL